jgi:hypothetical protein
MPYQGWMDKLEVPVAVQLTLRDTLAVLVGRAVAEWLQVDETHGVPVADTVRLSVAVLLPLEEASVEAEGVSVAVFEDDSDLPWECAGSNEWPLESGFRYTHTESSIEMLSNKIGKERKSENNQRGKPYEHSAL